ncbi:MAG: hypothetical protein E7660_01800 [Ruminococcaceae bacterium]|nr:hypothetical protein [Oscillospiraceae bacterium]
MKKRLLSLLIAVLIITSSLPLAALPVYAVEVSGDCSSTIKWHFNTETGVLTISGSGAIPNYKSYTQPWDKYSWDIESAIIQDGITAIGEMTFHNVKNMNSITLPETLESIGPWAFYYCTALETVNLPNSLTTLSYSAFNYCSSLKTIDIPEGITQLESSVFANCRNIESVTLPSNLKRIGDYSFNWCSKLKSINIPETVTSIGQAAFYKCPITEIELPKNLKSLGKSAFENCYHLKKIFIPQNITSILEKTFCNCYELTEVGNSQNIKSIGKEAFYSCKKLTDFKFSDQLSMIDEAAFQFSGLKVLNIPETATISTISKNAFSSTSLTKVVLPNKINSIYTEAFSYCKTLEEVILPNSLTTLGGEAFYACSALKNITLPDSLKTIYEGAFASCTSLEFIEISENLTQLAPKTFKNCKSLISVVLPKGTIDIHETTFEGCTSIMELYYPGTQEEFYQKIWFEGNLDEELENAYVFFNYVKPGYLMAELEDGTYTFLYAVKDLEEISVPSTYLGKPVTSIYDMAMHEKTALKSVTIPASVNYIGFDAFTGCTSLDSIIYEGDELLCPAEGYLDVLIQFKKLTATENSKIEVDFSEEIDTIEIMEVKAWKNGIYYFYTEVNTFDTIWLLDSKGNAISGAYGDNMTKEKGAASFTAQCEEGKTYYAVIRSMNPKGNTDVATVLNVNYSSGISGDVNGDGILSTKDVLLIRKYLGGAESKEKLSILVSDVTTDGKITTADILAIRKYLGGVITSLPIN